ncbi:MAG TPA: HlyD family efflux transporter periplasmic adaptor subunit [Mycobacteriales bacterium]|nr:HlyD family efflux transporter periplasmic adaptor subunit [Mycobacteriales bacterium]
MPAPRLLPVIAIAALALTSCTGGDGAAVEVGTVGRADVVELVNAPATVVARAQATVTAPADGTVVAVLVEAGESVVAGVPLLRLDSPAARTRLLAAQALLQAATTVDERAQATLALAAARRGIDGLTVRAPINGTVQLGGDGPAGGAPNLDDLIGALPAGIQGQAASALGGGGSEGSTATTTVAEIAPGVPVQQGTVLAAVFDLSALTLVAEVDETDIFLVTKGVPAEAELDAVPGASYPAVVRSVELAPTTSSRGGVTYRVALALQPGKAADGAVAPVPRPGMSAVADLRVREVKSAVSVPAAAVIRQGDRDAVWAVRDGRARAVLVTLGAQGDDTIEIRSGVAEGDRVVVRGADVVREGQEL